MESASSEGASSVLVVAESISSIRGFFSKFPSLFDEEELPNTGKYLLIFSVLLKKGISRDRYKASSSTCKCSGNVVFY